MQQCDRGHCAIVSRQNSFIIMDEEEETEEDEVNQIPQINSDASAKSESEEEDYESFFLQPASSPYNIKDKIAEANKLLLLEEDEGNNNNGHAQFKLINQKDVKVQFREDLVDFEPDSTDDDVQSIESYTEEVTNEELQYVLQDNKLGDIIEIEEDIIEESIIESNQQHSHVDVENVEDEVASAEEVDEIDEELEFLDEVILPQPPPELPSVPSIDKSIDFNFKDESDTFTDTTSTVIQEKRQKKKKLKKHKQPHEINCKKHCIEELESRLEQCIGRLRLNSEKPVCPTLKLHRRKCCGGGGCSKATEQKLPQYTGLHSEYGLSSAQIERLAKRKEVIKVKEEKERELTEAYRKRKIAQNEIIFRQWLKDISNRKHIEKEREKEIISTGSSNSSSRNYGICVRRNANSCKEKRVEKPRPKTANCITSIQLRLNEAEGSSSGKRRRPHTTSSATARILIEIPQGMLNDGFRLGDLFVKNNHSMSRNVKGKTSRQLHMVTVS